MQVNLATNLLEARAKSGLLFEDKEHKKKRSKRRSKKDGGSRSKNKSIRHQTKKTNRVVLPTWKYWYRK